ncbi:MAG: HAD-IA family hydrolase [Defluviitaleaceae bacterium]|nr:HAD-IA family hydrolase [Defluviitaleaceae bacterium]
MLKAILIDFDGVMIDTEILYYRTYKKWFKANANHDLTIEEFQLGIGTTDEVIFGYLLKEKGLEIERGTFYEDVHKEIGKQSESLPPKEGVVDFFKKIKERGLRLALVTSNARENVVPHLQRFQLLDQFDFLVTSDDVENIKPSPELYLKALELLNIKPEQALAIEDSLNGFNAARTAGIQTVAIPHELTESLEFEGAYKRLKSLTELVLP